MRYLLGIQDPKSGRVKAVAELSIELYLFILALTLTDDDAPSRDLSNWVPSGDTERDHDLVAHVATCKRCQHDESKFSPELQAAVANYREKNPVVPDLQSPDKAGATPAQ